MTGKLNMEEEGQEFLNLLTTRAQYIWKSFNPAYWGDGVMEEGDRLMGGSLLHQKNNWAPSKKTQNAQLHQPHTHAKVVVVASRDGCWWLLRHQPAGADRLADNFERQGDCGKGMDETAAGRGLWMWIEVAAEKIKRGGPGILEWGSSPSSHSTNCSLYY